jgi:hypothetical protein
MGDERGFAWAARFRRLARDQEPLDIALKGLHLFALATLTRPVAKIATQP